MTPREQLEALAGSTVYVNGAEYSADMIEPKTFDALRAVLKECEEMAEDPAIIRTAGDVATRFTNLISAALEAS